MSPLVQRLLGAACLALVVVAGGARGQDASPPSSGPDEDCLSLLGEAGVRFRRRDGITGVRTPVEVLGPLGTLRLVPRARRPPVMDCALARALAHAAPLFAEAGVDELGFSAAYDRRTRRGSSQLSAHAFGLAIDVHTLRGRGVSYDVARDFEAGVGVWRGLDPHAGDLPACVGAPRTAAGIALRTLSCRLKHHSMFRVVVTPDDDADHRDHLHLETFADPLARARAILGVKPLRSERAR